MPRTSTTMRPGETRNPLGRPKKEWSLTEALKSYMGEIDPATKKLRRDLLIEATFQSALKGDPASARIVWSYLEGMPNQRIESVGERRLPTVLVVTPAKLDDNDASRGI